MLASYIIIGWSTRLRNWHGVVLLMKLQTSKIFTSFSSIILFALNCCVSLIFFNLWQFLVSPCLVCDSFSCLSWIDNLEGYRSGILQNALQVDLFSWNFLVITLRLLILGNFTTERWPSQWIISGYNVQLDYLIRWCLSDVSMVMLILFVINKYLVGDTLRLHEHHISPQTSAQEF